MGILGRGEMWGFELGGGGRGGGGGERAPQRRAQGRPPPPQAQARALVHAPDARDEVAVVRGQHQEDRRFQHCRVVLGLLLPPRAPVFPPEPHGPAPFQRGCPSTLGGSCKPQWWQVDYTVQEGCFCSFLGGFGAGSSG